MSEDDDDDGAGGSKNLRDNERSGISLITQLFIAPKEGVGDCLSS